MKRWCSNSNGSRNRFPLALGALIVALMMITCCFVLVLGSESAVAEEDPPGDVRTGADIALPPWSGSSVIRFDPVSYRPYVPISYLSLLSHEVRPASTMPLMMVMVESRLYSDLSDELQRYAEDVERTGLGVSIWTISSLADPEEIKGILSEYYGLYPLVGCLMVGDISAAMYHIDTVWWNGDPDQEDFPSDLFYMDMDGQWGYNSGISMYDSHVDGTGDIEPEIWLGRLRTDQMTGDEVDMLEEYFDRNHDYRVGDLTFEDRALVYVDDDWAPGTDERDEVKLAFADTTVVDNRAATAKANYLNALTDSYTAVHLKCHGNPGGHIFKVPDPNDPSKSVGEDIYSGADAWVVGDDEVMAMDDNVLFYNLFVCSAARFTEPEYLAGWYVQSGDTLVAVGSAKTGSMIEESYFYDPIGDGASVGDAFQQWFQATYRTYSDSVPWAMGMTIIGDPTIRIAGEHEVNIETVGLPSGTFTDVVKITDPDGTITWGDLINGKFQGMVKHGSQIVVMPLFALPWYTPLDPFQFTVVEPIDAQIRYIMQHQVYIETHGLPSTSPATVRYTQMGEPKSFSIWDDEDFLRFCDDGTEVSVDEIVTVAPEEERYIAVSTNSWTLSTSLDEDVFYIHQYRVLVDIQTVGVHPLDVDNHVECHYRNTTWMIYEDLYDANDLDAWVNAGSDVIINRWSAYSWLAVRWTCVEPEELTVTGPIDVDRLYYEQCKMELESFGLDDENFKGTLLYYQFYKPNIGDYWDGAKWTGWCDISTPLVWSQFVQRTSCWRYHSPAPNYLEVIEPKGIDVAYHQEYKVTIAAEGLSAGLSTEVTVGVANVHDDDWPNFIVTLSSSNSFAWTGWVHVGTDMTALAERNSGADEKYILLCWTVDGTVFAPPTVYAMGPCHTYTAHYIGLKKEMSKEQATLTEPVMVHLKVSLTSAIDAEDKVTLIDNLPNEFSFVVGSTTDNGAKVTPTLANIMVAPYHQRLTFALGPGSHDIWFEVRVNRAYATDRTVTNSASATIDLKELDPMTLAVEDKLTVRPYVGPTFSVVKTGPDVVKWHTNVSWEMTFIVKDNYNYVMKGATVKDCFGPEIKYLANSVRANLVTKPIFTITGCPTKQVGMSWGLGDVQVGEAFMLQVTIYTTDKSMTGGQGFSMLGQNPLDFGASLRFINCNNNQVTLTTLPIWVKAIKPL